jgi:hypothetical protein
MVLCWLVPLKVLMGNLWRNPKRYSISVTVLVSSHLMPYRQSSSLQMGIILPLMVCVVIAS